MSDLYTEVHGAGPPLLLLHGWGLNLRVWDTLIPALTPRFKVFAMDLAGHGRSAWDTKARTLNGHAQCVASTYDSLAANDASIDVNNATILGWSFGGQVALTLAAKFRRLVLTATSPKFAASPDWPYGLSAPVLASFARQLETDYRQTVSDFLDLQTRGSVNGAEVLATLRNALFTHGEAQREALTEGLRILATADLREALPRITQRALVISGQYDRVTPPGAGKALAESLPNAQHLEIRRAGHAPFLSHMDTFITALFDATA
jgi:pimeloyl-[acyl-carrier protein] methyl ester esterase